MNKNLIINKEDGFTLIELLIVISIVGILAGIAIPNFIAYRNKSFCTLAEADASRIEGHIIGYFSIPSRIAITTADINYISSHNTFSISSLNPNIVITITVTDITGLCPAEYRNAKPVNAAGNGWNGNVYQKIIGL